jgi:hypothetical protein
MGAYGKALVMVAVVEVLDICIDLDFEKANKNKKKSLFYVFVDQCLYFYVFATLAYFKYMSSFLS